MGQSQDVLLGAMRTVHKRESILAFTFAAHEPFLWPSQGEASSVCAEQRDHSPGDPFLLAREAPGHLLTLLWVEKSASLPQPVSLPAPVPVLGQQPGDQLQHYAWRRSSMDMQAQQKRCSFHGDKSCSLVPPSTDPSEQPVLDAEKLQP